MKGLDILAGILEVCWTLGVRIGPLDGPLASCGPLWAPCSVIVYTWAFKEAAISLLWGLCIYHKGTWSLRGYNGRTKIPN